MDTLGLKPILPHHAFNRFVWLSAVFGILFLVVFDFDFAFNREINQLANRHTMVNFYRLFHRNLQRPVSAEANIALARSGMDINAKPSG